MEQICSFFKYLINSNTVNFLIMVLFLLWICKKMNISAMINNSIVKTKEEMLNSDKAKNDAGKEFYEAQKKVDELPNILKSINLKTMAEADTVCENYATEANRSVEAIKKGVSVAISDEERRISSLLTLQTLDKSVDKVKKELNSNLSANKQLQIKFVEQSLKEFERLSL